MFSVRVILFFLLAIALPGCTPDKPPVSSVVVSPSRPPSNTNPPNLSDDPREIPRAAEGKPQPKLPTLKLWVGTNTISAEVARTLSQIMTGMMWRTNMEEMEGMLFIMPGEPHKVGFWMRNTLLPLSCAYIDSEGTILELHNMQPRDETPIPSDSDQVKYVLEVKQGWFDRHNVKPGMLVATERGTLPKTFFHQN